MNAILYYPYLKFRNINTTSETKSVDIFLIVLIFIFLFIIPVFIKNNNKKDR